MEPIPQPPSHYIVGNAADVDPTFAAGSFWQLAKIYGDIFQLDLPGRKVVVCPSHDLVNELCDPKKFEKIVKGPLEEVRALVKDGLFTAYPGEHNWSIAHRILMPVFGPMGIRTMFPEMLDIASQMILKWDRLGPKNEILCSDDFTRLAFDTIGFCAYGFRFNEFYSEEMHPFATQMVDVLVESEKRANRLSITNHLRIWSAAKNEENIAAMHKVCDDIIAERKAHPQPEANDLLNAMLYAEDPGRE